MVIRMIFHPVVVVAAEAVMVTRYEGSFQGLCTIGLKGALDWRGR
jgi:hypothetical protein